MLILGVFLTLSVMVITEFSFNALLDSTTTRSLVDLIVAAELGIRRQWTESKKIFLDWLNARRAEKEAARKATRQEAARKAQEAKEAAMREAEVLRQQQIAKIEKKIEEPSTATPIQKSYQPTAITEQIDIEQQLSNQTPVIAPAPVSSRSGRSPEQLEKIIYGEKQKPQQLNRFSITGAVAAVQQRAPEQAPDPVPPVRFERANRETIEELPVSTYQQLPEELPKPLARRFDTQLGQRQKVASKPATPNNYATDPEIDNMLQSASIERPPQEQEEEVRAVKRPTSFSDFVLPPLELLNEPSVKQEQDDEELWERAKLLAEKCKEFSVTGKIQEISPGPVVTTFQFKPDPGVKYSRVTSLVDDLCLALKAESIRIDRIPGKSTVGIEVPNVNREIIYLREIVESDKFHGISSPLTLALGKTIDGKTHVADLAKMPHLLIAGATGTGKSVCLNSVIVSILCKASPDEVKMIMVDPKRLELGLYEGIPHLLTPIVLEPKRASNALKWAVGEMENRYKMLAGHGVRNIDQYNQMVRMKQEEIPALHPDNIPLPLPYIVIIIDELADLMMVASKDVETSITRLAQMARAVGIHLIIATQRPSVDVITGLIKANFPSRISFRVSSKVDSRTILDTNGAETLLGQGDMLFLPPGTSRLVRVHGAYVGEAEIGKIVEHIKSQQKPCYDESIQASDEDTDSKEAGNAVKDELYEEALRIVCQMGRASTSVLQRRLRIGYGRAAAILDMMEREGFVGPPDGSKPRVVKQEAYNFLERLNQMHDE
ncbi:MAG: DNA translocase FtsK [Blastocatellia bacterium]|nr:DNA translocase FtsK [Blastocatellia bacterium]